MHPALFLQCHVVETKYHSAIFKHSQSLDLVLGPALSTLQILTHQIPMIIEEVDTNSVPILLMRKQKHRKVEAPARDNIVRVRMKKSGDMKPHWAAGIRGCSQGPPPALRTSLSHEQQDGV